MEHSDVPRRQLLRETEFLGSRVRNHPLNLFIDGVQLLLKHHSQSLGIGLPTGRQLSGRAEEGDPVALVPVFLPRESPGQRSLVGYSPQGRKELDATEAT